MNPFFSIEGVSGALFFSICVLLSLYHSVRTSKFTTLHFSIVGLGTLYGLGMPIVVHGAKKFSITGYDFIERSHSYVIIHSFFSTIAVIGIYLGWRLLRVSWRSNLRQYFQQSQPKKMAPWLYFMLIVAIVSMYLYTKDYGGYLGYFSYNRLVRAGHFQLFERSSFSFLKPFGGFAYISAFGFWGLIISGRHQLLNYIGFALALSISVYVLMAFSGRLSMILFACVFPVSIALLRQTSPLVWSIILPVSAPLAVFGVYLISAALELKASDNLYQFAAGEISFPFIAFFAQINDGNTLQLFYHLILSPLYLLPSSLVGSWLSTASQINTTTIHGFAKGVEGVTSGMPVDLITYGLMQFHIIGVFIYAVFFGWMLRIITYVSESFSLQGVSATFTAYVAIRIGIFGALYADPKHLIEGNFPFIVTCIVISTMRFIGRRRMR